jgi:hypothetical protein
LDNFRILTFARSSQAYSPSPPRFTRSNETQSILTELSESDESSDEEHSNGPSTPTLGPSPLVYHMTTDQVQLPIDFSSSKMLLGETSLKASPLTWTWDQLTAANVTDHTKTIFTDSPTTLDFDLSPLLETYDYDLFGKVDREGGLVPGFEAIDLSGWNLDDEMYIPGTMAGSGLSIPDDVCYNSPPSSPKFGDFLTMDQGPPSPVIDASSPSPLPSADSVDEIFLNSIDSNSWNELPAVNWEEVSQITGIPLTPSS